ncbi:hypothetical protein D9M68_691240 [compost metagenome]
MKPSWPKSGVVNRPAKLVGPAVSGMSVSSVVSVGTATAFASIDGPSSSNLKASPMLRVAVAVSLSPSVMVAVSVTRLANARPAAEAPLSTGSSGSLCTIERLWVSDTLPVLATTEMVSATAPAALARSAAVPTRPTTAPLSRNRKILSPDRVSRSPLSAPPSALTPSA